MAPRTSQTHPLRISTVPCLAGRIGMTICPGKKGDSVFGAPWDRDLTTDLAVLVDWGCEILVTLIESHEFALLGLGAFPAVVRAAGLDWMHLPIRDLDVPDAEFERRWAAEGQKLLAHLRHGGNVMLHCRGGLGRTGLVAARLLIEAGSEPEEAIAAVRAARPGAIETIAQERYLRRIKRP